MHRARIHTKSDPRYSQQAQLSRAMESIRGEAAAKSLRRVRKPSPRAHHFLRGFTSSSFDALSIFYALPRASCWTVARPIQAKANIVRTTIQPPRRNDSGKIMCNGHTAAEPEFPPERDPF